MAEIIKYDGDDIAKKVRNHIDTLIVDALPEETINNIIKARMKALMEKINT